MDNANHRADLYKNVELKKINEDKIVQFGAAKANSFSSQRRNPFVLGTPPGPDIG